jgi:glyoxylase-like metal-dependent hydrolase (beta-lactamase superfamily II)
MSKHWLRHSSFPKAAVFLGAGDLPMIRGDKSHYPAFGKLVSAVVPLPPAPAAASPVHGGEQLRFDDADFTVVATPGHSPGSVVYWFNDVLFTGAKEKLLRLLTGA